MSDDHLDRDPGLYELNGGTAALVEQQRAGIMAKLRDTKSVSVTLLEPDGSGLHWSICDGDDAAWGFLVYVAVKAIRDAMAAMDTSPERVCGLVIEAIERGIGE